MSHQKIYSQIRIIGGEFRGRKINFLNDFSTGCELRPTPDRVRETLFNWLSQPIVNAECLDAFAGSGALSFEAISRGAKHVTSIEQSPSVAKDIQENTERFKINAIFQRLNILNTNTLDYLTQTTQTFDIIFLDPPFQKDLLKPSLLLIQQRRLLRSNGYLYVESNEPIELENWHCFRSKKAGNVYYGLFKLL